MQPLHSESKEVCMLHQFAQIATAGGGGEKWQSRHAASCVVHTEHQAAHDARAARERVGISLARDSASEVQGPGALPVPVRYIGTGTGTGAGTGPI